MGVITMKKIYVIQMHTKTIPSRIVSLFTLYKYSHVAISFNRNCNYIYSFGRRKINSILNGGFVMQNKSGDFFKKFKDTKCRIYEMEVTDKQYYDLVRMIKYMKKNSNDYGYDYLGIFLRFLKIHITFRNKYVCSYFVAQLLKDANVCSFNKDTCFIKPRDFENIDGFNLIYSGKYALYR